MRALIVVVLALVAFLLGFVSTGCGGGGLPIPGPCCDPVYAPSDPTIVCGENAERIVITDLNTGVVGTLCFCPIAPNGSDRLLPRCSAD